MNTSRCGRCRRLLTRITHGTNVCTCPGNVERARSAAIGSWRARKRQRGECSNCPAMAEPGRSRCQACADKHSYDMNIRRMAEDEVQR